MSKQAVTVDDKEIRRVFKNIDKYDKDTQNKLERLIVQHSLALQNNAKANILIDTGLARRSTLVRWTIKNGRKLGSTVGTFVNYAIFIERKKPYLFPAFERARTALLRDLRALFRGA